MISIDVMQDQSEIIHYEHPGVPLQIRTVKLSEYPDWRVLCHWHDDIELVHVVSGKMNYYVNGTRVLLNENDCVLVNTRQMHYGYDFMKQECIFSYVLFHPSLFTGNHVLLQNYVIPMLENQSLEYLYFDSKIPYGYEVAGLIDQLADVKENKDSFYEMRAIGIMHILWSEIFKHTEIFQNSNTKEVHADLKIQKDMVSFIHQHYAEKISLEDIAASGHVCRSKCCIIFKHYLQQSPIDFLNAYRLKVSCDFLVNTGLSITEIAFACGFNHLSYFSKMFGESYHCTPGEYRKAKGRVDNIQVHT